MIKCLTAVLRCKDGSTAEIALTDMTHYPQSLRIECDGGPGRIFMHITEGYYREEA